MYLPYRVPLFPVDLRDHIVRILDGVSILLDPALPAVQIFFQRLQVIGIHCGKHIRHHLDHMDVSGFFLFTSSRHFIADHDGTEIKARALDLKGIFRESLLFNILDIIIHPRGKRQDERNADDADRSGKCSQQRAGFFCLKVVKA